MARYSNINFSTPYRLRLPVVIRYIEERYVQEFWHDGSLRLSTLAAFRKHKDEQRHDGREGICMMQGRPQNIPTLVVSMSTEQSFVLCGTTVADRTLQASFSTESGFVITDAVSFAHAIMRHIPGCVGGIQGVCNYVNTRFTTVPDAVVFPEPRPGETHIEREARIQQLQNPFYYESLFTKDSSFAHQGEYRMMWFAGRPMHVEHLDIKCPEGRDYCERLE